MGKIVDCKKCRSNREYIIRVAIPAFGDGLELPTRRGAYEARHCKRKYRYLQEKAGDYRSWKTHRKSQHK